MARLRLGPLLDARDATPAGATASRGRMSPMTSRATLADQAELHQVRAELLALLKRLPWSVEPLDGFSDDTRRREVERSTSPGWTADEQAEVEKLRQRERELAVFVTCHRFWSEVSGPETVEARMKLKHAHEEPWPDED